MLIPARMHVQWINPSHRTCKGKHEMSEFEAYNGMPATKVAAAWRKSSYSNSQGNCVEFAGMGDGSVAVRNSRDPHGPALLYTRAEIEAMINGIKDGEFDDLLG
jgi:hypothetical protein